MLQCTVLTLLVAAQMAGSLGLVFGSLGLVAHASFATQKTQHLWQAADALRAERPESDAAAHNDATTSRHNRAAGSTWRFACRLDEGKSFDFVATLERETNPDYLADDANRYREAGPLTLIDPGPSIRKAYGWLAENDGPPKGEFTRITVSMRDGMLASTDGDLMSCKRA